ncbi:hypothetical protein [Psychrobacter urativorans]|uniref:Uracil-DNA glycosylase-like domain-containing protein n=1 Tax=Psychrobacter urativorans TaxID=45610 RepID=A0A0M4TAU7_9GAMM|nr:hypothetical protein [Psychrobacter urativorans]ALF58632.1 hypothetical protein AOC03_00050 [Psychrobacter urativorans]
MTTTSPLERYKLFDSIEDVTQLNVLLVLESPHINEYIHRHPAAGNAAAELTKFFTAQGYASCFNDDLPIGCNIKTQRYPFLGIINCSSLPMNKEFYPCTMTMAEEKAVLVDKLMVMRTQLSKGIDADYIKPSAPECKLFNDFAKRLTNLIYATTSVEKADDIIIIPCGYVATNFVKRFQANYKGTLNILKHLPHPSAADWEECIKNITITDNIPQDMLP